MKNQNQTDPYAPEPNAQPTPPAHDPRRGTTSGPARDGKAVDSARPTDLGSAVVHDRLPDSWCPNNSTEGCCHM
jgi:hypothetical protein